MKRVIMTKELCGIVTPNGPCTLKKGHRVEWHRHRKYETTDWTIKSEDGKVLETGENRVPLNYAITRQLAKHDQIVIFIDR